VVKGSEKAGLIEFIGEPCETRTPGHPIKRRRPGGNDFNKLWKKLALPVMTVNTINPVFLIKSGKIVGNGRGWGDLASFFLPRNKSDKGVSSHFPSVGSEFSQRGL